MTHSDDQLTRGGSGGMSLLLLFFVLASADLFRWGLLPDPVHGQSTSAGTAILGQVIEAPTRSPIEGARVQLSGDLGSRSALTDQDGRYRLQNLAPGRYELNISRLGYRTASLWIDVPFPTILSRSVGLEVEPIRLDAIVVREEPLRHEWSLRRAPASPNSSATPLNGAETTPSRRLDSRVMTSEHVKSLSSLGEPDVLRALQRLPGVTARGDYSAALWTRGATWAMTRILFDGIPLYDPLHMGGTTTGLSADGLESAVLLPGVRPATHTDGAAGVVGLDSRKAGEESSRLLAVTPHAVRARVEQRALDERMGLSVSARRSRWDWFAPRRMFSRESERGPIDYYFADVVGRFDALLPGSLELDAGALWKEDRLDGDVHRLVGASQGHWGNRLGWISVSRPWSLPPVGEVQMKGTLARSSHGARTRSNPNPLLRFSSMEGARALDWTDLEITHTRMRVEAQGARRHPGVGEFTWSIGADRIQEGLSQNSMGASDRKAPGISDPAELEYTRGWAQLDLGASPVTLSAGIAWDVPHSHAPPEMDALPNLLIRVDPNPWLGLEAAWGRSRQTLYPVAQAGRSIGPALGIGHVWMIAGDEFPVLDSEIGTLSAELQFSHGLGVGATAWQRGVDGLSMDGVITIQEGGLTEPSFRDPGSEVGRGLEVSAWRDEGPVTSNLSYSWGRAIIHGPDGATWTSPSERRHSVNLSVVGSLPANLRMSSFLTWETGWPFATGPWECEDESDCDIEVGDPLRPEQHSFDRSSVYRSLDVAVDWEHRRPRLDWGVSVSIRNVLGWENVSAFRPAGCSGRALVSVVCQEAVGLGSFASGPLGPTPAVSAHIRF